MRENVGDGTAPAGRAVGIVGKSAEMATTQHEALVLMPKRVGGGRWQPHSKGALVVLRGNTEALLMASTLSLNAGGDGMKD
jgi:hypothetical protein